MSDPPERETLHGIGRRKDAEFLRWVAKHGVEPFDSTVELVSRLRNAGVPTAVFSASRNRREVLKGAGVEGLFDAIVDGRDAARIELPGKPDPATLLQAARQLGADPGGSAVVEDSRAGVEAGHAGGFRMVVGVDRGGGGDALLKAAAHAVVTDLAQVSFEHAESPWRLFYRGFEPEQAVAPTRPMALGRPIPSRKRASDEASDGRSKTIGARPERAPSAPPRGRLLWGSSTLARASPQLARGSLRGESGLLAWRGRGSPG